VADNDRRPGDCRCERFDVGSQIAWHHYFLPSLPSRKLAWAAVVPLCRSARPTGSTSAEAPMRGWLAKGGYAAKSRQRAVV
jgi:hypothetical protein